ncbi:hypothetical protein QR680_003418 [Steinernema hermaphroditum]|uniref:Uncharacterized protein n=1 Tax=Steinernema hermaphroditum TaxID=289476 RepID=A0AA39H7L2_9BILA|nr:hypothetical protein QR680_003418 [Steinernema hermaphroditum]
MELTEMASCSSDAPLEFETNVVIIGNGPAGLSLSAFLSGWTPFYNENKAHPNARLHARLCKNLEESLLDQDLSWFEDEFGDSYNQAVRPYSALYDSLARPEADMGINHPRALRMNYKPENAVDHIVLGQGPIGGSWNDYDDEMVSVSFGSWMDLPGLSIFEWLGGEPMCARLPAIVIRTYMQAYADATHVADRVRCFHTVTNLSKFVDEATGLHYWHVFGYNEEGQLFMIKCEKVVLACGKNRCKTLKVDGEADEENVVYEVTQLKKFLDRNPCLPLSVRKEIDDFDTFATPTVPYLLEPECDRRVVVVGDGISAADAVLHCLNNDVPVLHVMRRSERQLRSVMLARLSTSVYPEYTRVFRLMTGKVTDPFYERINCGEVMSIKMPSVAVVRSPQGIEAVSHDSYFEKLTR